MCNVRLPLDICASVTMTNKTTYLLTYLGWPSDGKAPIYIAKQIH